MGPNGITKIGNLNLNNKILNKQQSKDSSFEGYLKNALDKVNGLQVEADQYKQLLATGQVDNIHQVTIAAEKADIALQFTMTVRGKILDAYNEIMRMQI
ncbi:flagellar hook-basal body complex protein FliE [Sporosalibacterium faouarense]|uniref:flagellar hook-basal body complex protein FliE n=1 Tax=Sporosalibacterium faouarense TaxID=516123 RepID=UPI00141C2F21|nr:flagellar hook-basal body complex protein FliE [Sporosalibacterium faouarense]MTI47985.1 flagellar hook-basal body complex protein FliE [Bacillota bacterium]